VVSIYQQLTAFTDSVIGITKMRLSVISIWERFMIAECFLTIEQVQSSEDLNKLIQMA